MLYLNRIVMIGLVLLFAACSAKTSKEVVADLWAGWEKAESQMQVNFPDAVPLILVHGWNGGESTWPAPARLMQLENRLQRDIYLFTYRTGVFANRYPPLEVLEEQLHNYIKAYEKVDIIAHSMGGLLVRHYLAHHANISIRRVVFLATPHFGTNAAQVLMRLGAIGSEGNIQATEIQPGSDFLWQLNSLEGRDLGNVEVLNIYVAEESLLKSDLVVSPTSAHLPWVSNAIVLGMHHTVAQRLDQFDMIVRFIQTGELPEAAQAPDRKHAWLRFASGGKVERLAENNFRAYDSRGQLDKKYDLCCRRRSGLYDTDGLKTVVIEGLKAGVTYQFTAHRGATPVRISSDELLTSKMPVVIKQIQTKAAVVPQTAEKPVSEPEMIR